MAKLIMVVQREEIVKDQRGQSYALKHATHYDPSRYDGATLREIRKRKGVGRPPKAQ